MNFFWFPFEDLPFIIIAFAVSLAVHEWAHAYTAYLFGDRTAYDAGRVTLNPRAHLDVFGTIMILLAGFGWAKPVPYNPNRFRNPRLMSIATTAAGPISNLILVIISIFLLYFLNQTGLLQAGSVGLYKALVHLFYYLIFLNITLFLFNLIPLPPLDGYGIVKNMLPYRTRLQLEQHEHWGAYLFLLMVFIPPLRDVTIDPVLSYSGDIFFHIVELCEKIFTKPMNWYQFFVDLN
ncbi:site-2 protease family protein [Paenibacillus xylaniclasticus]|uniref:site-2 protease family protein n=1 Tax=Paenibacillus xylaniclasticus TaxID=588083 RepID=UPI000FD85FA2|nr:MULTISPECIES: site-2 protease family protein [Paenibacillus]GFN30320.1 zinc metalloprotease [Paenibacillus curdlanolyticus]